MIVRSQKNSLSVVSVMDQLRKFGFVDKILVRVFVVNVIGTVRWSWWPFAVTSDGTAQQFDGTTV